MRIETIDATVSDHGLNVHAGRDIDGHLTGHVVLQVVSALGTEVQVIKMTAAEARRLGLVLTVKAEEAQS